MYYVALELGTYQGQVEIELLFLRGEKVYREAFEHRMFFPVQSEGYVKPVKKGRELFSGDIKVPATASIIYTMISAIGSQSENHKSIALAIQKTAVRTCPIVPKRFSNKCPTYVTVLLYMIDGPE